MERSLCAKYTLTSFRLSRWLGTAVLLSWCSSSYQHDKYLRGLFKLFRLDVKELHQRCRPIPVSLHSSSFIQFIFCSPKFVLWLCHSNQNLLRYGYDMPSSPS